MLKRVIVIGLTVLVAACSTQPIRNFDRELVPTSISGKPLTIEQVETAILRGVRTRGWTPTMLSPGVIEARINVRSHRAVVEIPYSANYYSILYKDSDNLDHRNGTIHRNYNKWVINLSAAIQQQLNNL